MGETIIGFNLGDVPDIIGLTPNIPYAGNTNADGLQESHLLGTDFLKTTLKNLVGYGDTPGYGYGDTPLNCKNY